MRVVLVPTLCLLAASMFVASARAQSGAPATPGAGAYVPDVLGARAAAMGGAGVALGGDGADPWGARNPAAWAALPRRTAALYGDEGFGLSELRLAAARIVVPTRIAAFAVGAQAFGYESFRASAFTLGAARAFSLGTSRVLMAGAAAHLHTVSIPDYGSASVVTLDVGVRAALVPGLDAGFRASNVAAGSLAGREPLPRTLALGFAYRAHARLTVAADVEKDVRYPASLRAGVEARPVAALALRAGATTAPRAVSAGVGLRTGPLAIDLAAARHESLGWTPAVGLGVRF